MALKIVNHTIHYIATLYGHDSSNLFLPSQYKPQPRLPTIHMLNNRTLGVNHISGGSASNILDRRDKDGASSS